jgi:integrase
MTLRCRDLDDNGRLLWVASEGGKTAAAERQQEIPDELRPHLKRIVQDRPPDAWLFDFEPDRKRRTTNLYKSRRDALLRRVRSLCKAAGVPEVVSHSMRGLHAKLATESGVTSHAVAAALGHTSFAVTARHYVGAAVTRRSANRRTLRVLRGAGGAVTRAASEFTARQK